MTFCPTATRSNIQMIAVKTAKTSRTSSFRITPPIASLSDEPRAIEQADLSGADFGCHRCLVPISGTVQSKTVAILSVGDYDCVGRLRMRARDDRTTRKIDIRRRTSRRQARSILE